MTTAITQFLSFVEDDLTGERHTALAKSFISEFPAEMWAPVFQVHYQRNPDHIGQWWAWCQRQPEFSGLVAAITARLPLYCGGGATGRS